MTSNGRRYGYRQSYSFPVWNGIFEHRSRIGEAIWVFLWCIDRITREKDGVGIVYGGAPVRIRQMVEDLDFSYHTIERHFKILESGRYVARKRTPCGYVIHVSKSLKFRTEKRLGGSSRNGKSLGEGSAMDGKGSCHGRQIRPAIDGRNKEDVAVDFSKDPASDGQNRSFRSKAKPEPKRDRWGTILADQGVA